MLVHISFRPRIHTLQKLKQVAVGRQHDGSLIGHNGLIGLHCAGKFIKLDGFSALVVSLGIDLGGLRICNTANLFNLPVSFRLNLVQVTNTVSANPGGFTITL